ncbi:hypothetical protein [Paraburkholderia sp. GAS448]|uniref:hypothetical protein n=1 Tax=Paraburkholderia sp. GAS448 TaxID=3035136 RepID=UPI003D194D2B
MNSTRIPASPATNAADFGLSTYEEQRAQLDERVRVALSRARSRYAARAAT